MPEGTFVEWYEELKKYGDKHPSGFNRSTIESCGEECWRIAFEEGLKIEDAFREGFDLDGYFK